MFKRILIPLDGSALAEQALAPACRIAEQFGSELLLLRVVMPERSLPGFAHLTGRADSELANATRPWRPKRRLTWLVYTCRSRVCAPALRSFVVLRLS